MGRLGNARVGRGGAGLARHLHCASGHVCATASASERVSVARRLGCQRGSGADGGGPVRDVFSGQPLPAARAGVQRAPDWTCLLASGAGYRRTLHRYVRAARDAIRGTKCVASGTRAHSDRPFVVRPRAARRQLPDRHLARHAAARHWRGTIFSGAHEPGDVERDAR